MKDLFLYLKRREEVGIVSLGMEISWTDTEFRYDNFVNLGIFDNVMVSLKDGLQGHLIISVSNNNNREVNANAEFLQLKFRGVEKEVVFVVAKQTADDKDGNPVEIKNNVVNYPIGGGWEIDWIWR